MIGMVSATVNMGIVTATLLGIFNKAANASPVVALSQYKVPVHITTAKQTSKVKGMIEARVKPQAV